MWFKIAPVPGFTAWQSYERYMASPSQITVTLSLDEALVLFDSLGRQGEEEEPLETPEMRVLWSIEAQLEKVLVEPFARNYPELVAAARTRV